MLLQLGATPGLLSQLLLELPEPLLVRSGLLVLVAAPAPALASTSTAASTAAAPSAPPSASFQRACGRARPVSLPRVG